MTSVEFGFGLTTAGGSKNHDHTKQMTLQLLRDLLSQYLFLGLDEQFSPWSLGTSKLFMSIHKRVSRYEVGKAPKNK